MSVLSVVLTAAQSCPSLQDCGWWRLMAVAVGFVTDSRPDPTHLDVYVSIRSALVCALPISGVVVTFADDLPGEWEVPAMAAPIPENTQATPAPDPEYPGAPQRPSVLSQLSGRASFDAGGPRDGLTGEAQARSGGVASGSGRMAQQRPHAFTLEPGRWAQVGVRIAPRAVGRLRCEKVTVSIGSHSSVCFHVQSFPTGSTPVLGDLGERMPLGRGCESVRGSQPFKGLPPVLDGVLGGVALPVLHVGPLPTLKVCILLAAASCAKSLQLCPALCSVCSVALRPCLTRCITCGAVWPILPWLWHLQTLFGRHCHVSPAKSGRALCNNNMPPTPPLCVSAGASALGGVCPGGGAILPGGLGQVRPWSDLGQGLWQGLCVCVCVCVEGEFRLGVFWLHVFGEAGMGGRDTYHPSARGAQPSCLPAAPATLPTRGQAAANVKTCQS